MSATKPGNVYSEPTVANIEAAEEFSKGKSSVGDGTSPRSVHGCTVSKKVLRRLEVAILTAVIGCVVGLLCLPSAILIARLKKVLCIV